MFKTPVLSDTKLGFLDGLSAVEILLRCCTIKYYAIPIKYKYQITHPIIATIPQAFAHLGRVFAFIAQ